jgi:Spy/CpxP family protein refolding chaperone
VVLEDRIAIFDTVEIHRGIAALALVIAFHFTPTDAACEPGPATSSSELADAEAALSSALGKPSSAPAAASTPGAERVGHLHHLGAKQFYLDRAKALALTEEQQTRLRRLWEFDQVEKARFRDALTNTERGLWRLTGAEEPSLPAIEASVRAVEKLKADRRIAFIRRVMDAAAVLTVHQREMLRMAKGTR